MSASAATTARRVTPTGWIDIAVLTLLALLAIAGFRPALGTAHSLIGGIGGLVLGTGVALLSHRYRLGWVTTLVIGLVVYFLLGSALTMPGQALAGVLPTAYTLGGLVLGAVYGWSDIVTLQAPVAAPPYVAVVPYVAAFLTAVAGVTLALRWLPRRERTPLRASVLLIAPTLLYAAGILLGTDRPFLAGVRGIVFAAVALIWLGRRHRGARGVAALTDAGTKRRAVAGIAAVIAGAVVLGGVGGAALAPGHRYVLRDAVQPPFDPQNYPAPLAAFRQFVKNEAKKPLFTVTGLHSGEKIRMATLDSYDGQVWSVAGPSVQTDGSGGFELLGRRIPPPALFTPGGRSTLHIDIEDYDRVWLPVGGYPRTLDFTAHRGVDPTTTVRVNPDAGAAAVTSGVARGLDYTVGVREPRIPPDDKLVDVPTARLTMPPVTVIPDVVAAKAKEFAGGASSAIQQLRNIERSFKKLGYLSHGLANDPVPSRAGEGADRMVELLSSTPMIGDQEQYTSAFALMARQLGYPVRIVMGFAPKVKASEHTVTVRGSDTTAWDEVAFQGVGWVAFDPTPTKTNAPKAETTRPKIEPQPQVRQPPTMQQKHDEVLTPVKTSNKNPHKKKPHPFVIPAWVWWTAGGVATPFAILFVVILLIAAAKTRRRARRRGTGPPDARASGSWDELTDRYAELGLALPGRATRRQGAEALRSQCERQGLSLGEVDLTALALRVDRAVFSALDAGEDELDDLWRQSADATDASLRSAGWLRRRLASLRFRRRGARAPGAARREPAVRRVGGADAAGGPDAAGASL